MGNSFVSKLLLSQDNNELLLDGDNLDIRANMYNQSKSAFF